MGTSSKPQTVNVLVDTASFELWINPSCSHSSEPELCGQFGEYDPTQSTTSLKLGSSDDDNGDEDGGSASPAFNVKFASGYALGSYYSDDVFISGMRIQSQSFGVANETEQVWSGILGLAHGRGGADGEPSKFVKYPQMMDSIVSQSHSSSKLFSMDLGSAGRGSGKSLHSYHTLELHSLLLHTSNDL